jgi:hypothetical protein
MLPGMDEHELQTAALVTLARAGITLAMLANLFQHGHRLAVYCHAFRRWHDFDLHRLAAQGYGPRRLADRTVRCRACGGPGLIQLRPPVPRRGRTR